MVLEITDEASHHAADFALRLANSYDPAREPADHLSEPESAFAFFGSCLPEKTDPVALQYLRPFRDKLRKGLIAAANGQTGPDAEIAENLALPWRIEVQSGEAFRVGLRPEGTISQRLTAWAALGYFALLQTPQDRLRVCQSQPCEEIFRDVSKPGRQRFCCKRCANRFNVAQYRERRKKDD